MDSATPYRLATHVWHAKRFTMARRCGHCFVLDHRHTHLLLHSWGCVLALGLVGKGHGARAFLHKASTKAVMHDASYWRPMRLTICHRALLTMLRPLVYVQGSHPCYAWSTRSHRSACDHRRLQGWLATWAHTTARGGSPASELQLLLQDGAVTLGPVTLTALQQGQGPVRCAQTHQKRKRLRIKLAVQRAAMDVLLWVHSAAMPSTMPPLAARARACRVFIEDCSFQLSRIELHGPMWSPALRQCCRPPPPLTDGLLAWVCDPRLPCATPPPVQGVASAMLQPSAWQPCSESVIAEHRRLQRRQVLLGCFPFSLQCHTTLCGHTGR